MKVHLLMKYDSVGYLATTLFEWSRRRVRAGVAQRIHIAARHCSQQKAIAQRLGEEVELIGKLVSTLVVIQD